MYESPSVRAARSAAATVTSQVFESRVHVSVTLLIVTVTVCPSSAPLVVTVTVPSASSSAALRYVSQLVDTVEIEGWVLSIVTDVASVTAVTAVPAFPASSLNAIENVTTPSPTSSAMSTSQVQASFPPSVTTMDPARALPSSSAKVQVGVEIVSPAVKLRVIVSPFIPPAVVSMLSVTIETGLRVGTVSS